MADWAFRLFYVAVVLGAAFSLAAPDLLKITQANAEQIAMIAVLPVFLFVAFALKKPVNDPTVTDHETRPMDS